MKKIIIFCLLLVTVHEGYSQVECEYKIKIDSAEEIFKLTPEQLVEFMFNKDQNVFIYFSLMREGDIKSMVLQISLNSREMPQILCFDQNSRVSFKLRDGSFASLRYLGDVNCGRQTRNEETLHNSSSEAAFLLDEVNLERLRATPMESMRISTMKANFDIDFKNIISNRDLPEPIYPKEFFVKYSACLD
jgi:hypothetical protein